MIEKEITNCEAHYMPLYHCSTEDFEPGTFLVGLKAAHKRRQRMGQRLVDEIFENVRKQRFQLAPSLFTSLWVTNVFDMSIARKMFEETCASRVVVYEVRSSVQPYRIEAHWEVVACKSVTQSNLRGGELIAYIESLACRFWQPDTVDDACQTLLCPDGASVARVARVIDQSCLLV